MDRLSLVLLLVTAFLPPSLSTCVTGICNCSLDLVYNQTFTCHTKDLKNDLRNSIREPGLIRALTVIDDSTTIIPKGAFIQFSNLRYLAISIEKLKIWKGNLSRELPSLEGLVIISSNLFTLPDHVLQAPKLQNITGVTWSDSCSNCTLLKNETNENVTQLKQGTYDLYPPSRCRGSRYMVSHVSRTIAAHGFLPLCLSNKKCFTSEIAEIPLHKCWKSANSLLYAEYFFAPLVLLLNIMVFATTLTNKSLTRVPAMLLVSNLAVSDFFLGVYSLVLTCLRHTMEYKIFNKLIGRLCPFIGFLWVFGQVNAAISSVLLTTERYVALIFSMRPSAKFTPKICLRWVIISWTIAIVMALLPVAGIGTYTTTTFCLPIQPSKQIPYSFAYSASLVAIGFLLYLITLPMYLHIFVHVRRSGTRMGVKRDGRLAKKISILVFSNMIFFLLPVFIGLIWLMTKAFDNISLSSREILVGSLPTVCLSINSFLNPLLYAFRDRRFQFVIRQRCCRLVHPNTIEVHNVSYKSKTDGRSDIHEMKRR